MTKKPNSKHDRILDAAYDLFIGKGYWDTKIIDIADAAGIGKGTVYEYFESKDTLFFELFQIKVAAGYDVLNGLSGKEISSTEKLREYLEIELTNASRYTFSKNFLMDVMMKSDAFRNPALIESIHELVSMKFAILFGIIDEGIKNGEFRDTDPHLAAVTAMGSINAFISIRYIPFYPIEVLSPEKAREWDGGEFLDLILNGLKP
jgi:AcrR family transcriptional regulator